MTNEKIRISKTIAGENAEEKKRNKLKDSKHGKKFQEKDWRYYKKRQKKETLVPKKENCRKLWTNVHTSMLKHCR